MNAQELFFAGGKSAGVWFCSDCRHVKKTEAAANECCRPWSCRECRVDVARFRILCEDCSQADRKRKDESRLAAAELVTGWGDFVHSDGVCGNSDGFFSDVGEFVDFCFDNGIDPPSHVFCCKPEVLTIHVGEILERLEEQGYEEMTEFTQGLDEFRDAVATFNQRNRQVFTVWKVDHKRKVAVDFGRHEYRPQTLRNGESSCADCHAPPSHPIHQVCREVEMKSQVNHAKEKGNKNE